jgi:hypothetical protein
MVAFIKRGAKSMAVILEYRIQFLFAFIILLMLLLIIPMRAETADVFIEQIATGQPSELKNKSWFNHAWGNFIENNLYVLSCTKNSQTSDEKAPWIFNDLLHVHLYTSLTPLGQISTSGSSDDLLVQKFQTRILPFLEISYSLTEKISLELRGHLNRHSNTPDTSSGNTNNIYGYTFFFGPSVYGGKPRDPIRVYTHFGLGYKFLDNCKHILSDDGTSSMSTGFSFGL